MPAFFPNRTGKLLDSPLNKIHTRENSGGRFSVLRSQFEWGLLVVFYWDSIGFRMHKPHKIFSLGFQTNTIVLYIVAITIENRARL